MLRNIRAAVGLVLAVVVVCPFAPAFAGIREGGKSGGGGSSYKYPPANLQECLEDCAYQHGRDIEACSRLKDPKKRPACYDAANQKHAQCKRDCEKKYKPKE
jgi:hypothetical protein